MTNRFFCLPPTSSSSYRVAFFLVSSCQGPFYIIMSQQQPGSPGLQIPKTRGSPEKKVSFSFTQPITETISSLLGKKMQTTPNARNSSSLNATSVRSSGRKTRDKTPARRRESSAAVRKELAALQPLTPEGQKPVWQEGNTRLLSQNLESLLRAVDCTPGGRSAMAPVTPNTVNTSTGSPSKKGKKRPRPDDDYDDDDDTNKENQTPRPIKRRATRANTTAAATNGTTASTITPAGIDAEKAAALMKDVCELSNLPIPPLPLSNIVQVQMKVDLATLAPQPLRISYKPHPLEDRSDGWYTEMFRRLFRQSDRFSEHFFGVHNLKVGVFFEPWAAGMSDEFITWAEQVAEPDAYNIESWDELLRDTLQRKWLVMGILMKIIKVKIFDADMFGANKEQRELMHGISRALLGREGKTPHHLTLHSH